MAGKRKHWRLGLILLLGLAACTSPATTEPPAGPDAPPSQATEILALDGGAPTEAAQAAASDSEPAATQDAAEAPTAQAATAEAGATTPPTPAEPTALPPTTPPTAAAIADEFTPTDPATVNLAAGQPQLVEFFAFW